MRTLPAATITALALLAGAPAAAQTSAFINSGATVPTGDYAEFYLVSYNGSITVDVAVSDHIAVGARAGFHRAGLRGRALLEAIGLSGAAIGVEGGAASLTFVLPTVRVFQTLGPVEVYGIGGIGFVRAASESFRVFSRGSSESFSGSAENAIGTQLGVGARLPAGPFSVFGEFDYVIAFTEASATTAVPGRLGIAYTFGWEP